MTKKVPRWPTIAVFVFFLLLRGLLIGGFWLLVLLAIFIHLARSYYMTDRPAFAPPQKIIFLDLETTGLNPSGNLTTAAILEIAMVAVEVPRFRELDYFTTPVARAPGVQLQAGCDDYVRKMHTESGLWADVEARGIQRGEAEKAAVAFYNRHCSGYRVALAGSNPDFDRRWLDTWMPELSRKLSHRNFDVNTLFLMKQYMFGAEKSGTKHRALDDCRQAIAGVHQHFDLMKQVFGGR